MVDYVGLHLDEATNDLAFDALGALRTVAGKEAVGQHARQRFMSFVGEWFLDTSAGLPWLPGNRTGFAILGNYDQGPAESVMKAEIRATPGVMELLAFEARITRPSRGLIVDVEIDTVAGPTIVTTGIAA